MDWLPTSRFRDALSQVSQAAESWQLQDRLQQAADSLQLQEKVGRATETVHQRFSDTLQQTLYAGDHAMQFDHEARNLALAGPASAAATLQSWVARLEQAPGAERSAKAPAPGSVLTALIRSRASITAVIALVQTPEHRKALLTKTDELRAALLRILTRVSDLAEETLESLIVFLAQTHDDLERATESEDASVVESMRRTATWLQQLLESTLRHGHEASLLEHAAHIRAARRSLDALAVQWAEEPCSVEGGAAPADASPGAPPRGSGLEPGALVCAAAAEQGGEAAGSGAQNRASPLSWRPAKIKSVIPGSSGYAEVEWLQDSDDPAEGPMSCSRALVIPAAISEAAWQSSTGEACSGQVSCDRAAVEAASAQSQELRSLLSECCGWHIVEATGCSAKASGTAERLRALREEGVLRAEALVAERSKCQSVVESAQSQVKESTDTFRQALESLRERKDANSGQMSRLLAEKGELLNKLAALDEQLRSLETEGRKLVDDERRLEENMRHVSNELSGWLSSEGQRHEDLIEEHRMLTGIAEVAEVVEVEAAARDAAVAAAQRDSACVAAVAVALSAACVQSEFRRLAALERLAAGLPGQAEPRDGAEVTSAWAQAEMAASQADQLAQDIWRVLGLPAKSTGLEESIHGDALILKERCKALAGSLRARGVAADPPEAKAGGSGGPAASHSSWAGGGSGPGPAPAAPQGSAGVAQALNADDDVAEDAAE